MGNAVEIDSGKLVPRKHNCAEITENEPVPSTANTPHY